MRADSRAAHLQAQLALKEHALAQVLEQLKVGGVGAGLACGLGALQHYWLASHLRQGCSLLAPSEWGCSCSLAPSGWGCSCLLTPAGWGYSSDPLCVAPLQCLWYGNPLTQPL